MRIGIVGCGYVADFYLYTLVNHPGLQLMGVHDRDVARARRFASFHSVPRVYLDLKELLEDPQVELVVNLTNPRSHFEVTRACLEAGKHVYSEKPLAMEFPQARQLVDLARERGLGLSGAPSSVLGESAQTLWHALRRDTIGRVRLVYAELDGGMIHRAGPESWRSDSESPWPTQDEFEVGCTLEHAGYYVTWLVAFFGPARRVTAFSSPLLPDKLPGIRLDPRDTPDFSVGLIEFASGVVARITCGIVAPRNHSLTLVGDEGTLSTREAWDFASPVRVSKRSRWTLRAEKYPLLARLVGLGPRRYRHVRRASFRYGGKGAERMDFSRGVAELAASIEERRACRIDARFVLHVNEIALALQYPTAMGSPRDIETSFDPPEPMPWART